MHSGNSTLVLPLLFPKTTKHLLQAPLPLPFLGSASGNNEKDRLNYWSRVFFCFFSCWSSLPWIFYFFFQLPWVEGTSELPNVFFLSPNHASHLLGRAYSPFVDIQAQKFYRILYMSHWNFTAFETQPKPSNPSQIVPLSSNLCLMSCYLGRSRDDTGVAHA